MKRFATAIMVLALSLISVPASAVEANYGYDVSWPQCSSIGSLPTDGAFKVVGVTGGMLYTSNACLTEQLLWAGAGAELYVNTGNPGPVLSVRYTAGTVAGKTCYTSNKNSSACAFLYGYRGAADAFARAKAVFDSNGWTDIKSRTWWLDVERVNSWRGLDGNLPSDNGLSVATAQALNVANLQGAMYYFESVAKVDRIGIYSVTSHWQAITGGSTAFSDHETWMAVGQDGEQAAISECSSQPGFTGGPETRVQYIDTVSNLDVNVPCTFQKAASASAYAGTKSTRPSRLMTLKATLRTALGTPMANRTVQLVFNRKTYTVTTNASGVASKTVYAPKYRGNYRVTTAYVGNDLFTAASSTSYVKVYW